MKSNSTFIISRTDSIGDVVLTLPMAGVMKAQMPNCKIIFLGNSYTKNIIEACTNIDYFLDIKDVLMGATGLEKIKSYKADIIIHVFPNKMIAKLAKQAKIKSRIGTTNRLFHWLTCNTLVKLSRKKSVLHEAQLNLKLLQPLNIRTDYSLDEIKHFYGLTIKNSNHIFEKFELKNGKTNVILHPKSKGSAREWGKHNFENLIELLDAEKFNIFITGTKEEKPFADEIASKYSFVNNLCGTMQLNEFIEFINCCDVLVACSTGPLHIAAALGKLAIGLYAPMKPIFPQRWAPIGINATFLVENKNCNACKNGGECLCIMNIKAENVNRLIQNNSLKKTYLKNI
jgi:ADP-heptose:LPS heptosyltransferase